MNFAKNKFIRDNRNMNKAAIENGFNRFVRKPQDPDVLIFWSCVN
jgi:hypothetical protein